jgi:hypothetical protein
VTAYKNSRSFRVEIKKGLEPLLNGLKKYLYAEKGLRKFQQESYGQYLESKYPRVISVQEIAHFFNLIIKNHCLSPQSVSFTVIPQILKNN